MLNVTMRISIFLTFQTRYSALYGNKDILKYRTNLPPTPHGTLKKWRRRISSEHYKTLLNKIKPMSNDKFLNKEKKSIKTVAVRERLVCKAY